MEKLELEIDTQESPRRIRLGPERDLPQSEGELVQELLRSLRAIRYGSINLTVHDGRIVEIQKTERIRKAPVKKD